jgi:hypothetical protein
MPTRKILDWARNNCKDPEHDIPNMMVFEPGVYEHECPSCGKKIIFTQTRVDCAVKKFKKDCAAKKLKK